MLVLWLQSEKLNNCFEGPAAKGNYAAGSWAMLTGQRMETSLSPMTRECSRQERGLSIALRIDMRRLVFQAPFQARPAEDAGILLW